MKIASFYALSFILLAITFHWQQKDNAPYRALKKPAFINQKIEFFKERFKSKANANIFSKIVTSYSRSRLKEIKNKMKLLGTIHILTPSGIHLSAIRRLIVSLPFGGILKFILIALYFLPGLFSLKRMIFLSILPKKLGHHSLFVVTFLVDLLRGSYNESPISFCFSFLFLGVIFFAKKNLWLHFFASQLIVSYFLKQNISPLAIFFSPLLTLLFTACFPFFFITYFLPLFNWQINICSLMLNSYLWITDILFKVTTIFPLIHVDLIVLCIAFALLFKRLRLSIFILIFCSSSLNIRTSKKRHFIHKQIIYSPDENSECKKKFMGSYWEKKCKKKPLQ